jgi:hypothetical protein
MGDQSAPMVGSSQNGTSSNNCGSGGGDYASNNGHGNNHEEYSNNNQQEQQQQNQSIQLDETNRDIVRLIGQHLKLIGLERTAQMLMQESGKLIKHLVIIIFINLFVRLYTRASSSNKVPRARASWRLAKGRS